MAAVNEPPTAAQISVYMAQIGSKGGVIGGKRKLAARKAARVDYEPFPFQQLQSSRVYRYRSESDCQIP